MKINIFPYKKIVCLFFLFSFVKLHAQTAQDYYKAAVSLYKNKQYSEAIENLDTAIELNHNYTYAYQVRGNAFYALKQYKQAFEDYNHTVVLAPNNEINYYNRGNVYNATRCYDSALLDYNHSLSIKPVYVNALENRGVTYGNLKNYELAIKDFNKAIGLDSNFYYAYNSRGLAYLYTGQYDSAINDFKKAIALDTNQERPAVIINIIEPLAHVYRFSEAAKYYNDFRSRYGTGFIDAPYWNYFREYIEAVTENLSKDDYAGALIHLNKAEELYSVKTNTSNEDEQINFNGGQNLYSAKPKTEVSDESARRGYSSILALKGYALEKLDSIDDAKKAYDQALLINSLQPDVLLALQKLSKKEEALVLSDSTPPVIEILEPVADKRSISVDDDKTAGSKQRIRGQAIDKSGIKSITLNNVRLKVENNGYFDTTVIINTGVNVFTIAATDKNANSIYQNISIVTGLSKTIAKPVPVDTAINSNPVYNAILIAESNYVDKNIATLPGPKKDMDSIYNLLINKYSFAPQNTDTLVDATKLGILEAIVKKANAMTNSDNLFVFYAGHGQMITNPDSTEEGFLIPQDAVKDISLTYINSNDLLRAIQYSKARHILFVADACFAGSLRSGLSNVNGIATKSDKDKNTTLPPDAPVTVLEAYKDRSRRLLSSGNRTVVPDSSLFIKDLCQALQNNHQRYVTAEQLIDSFKYQYTTSTNLTIQYLPILDDLGGHFVFIRK